MGTTPIYKFPIRSRPTRPTCHCTLRYRQVGNALPVPVASWVLAGIAHTRPGADAWGR